MGLSHPVRCLYYYAICVVLLFGIFVFLSPSVVKENDKFIVRSMEDSPEIIIPFLIPPTRERNKNCTYFNCFNVYKCGYMDKKLSVYIYPIHKYKDEQGNLISIPFSREFLKILHTIYNSHFYTSDPQKACIFVPAIDLLNQNTVQLKQTAQLLSSLPFWNKGINHILFNLLPGSFPDYNPVLEIDSNQAMIAGASFSTSTYRKSFDVSIPVFNPVDHASYTSSCEKIARPWLVTSAQINIHPEYRHELQKSALEHPELLLLDRCSWNESSYDDDSRCRDQAKYAYPNILKSSTFCLVIRGSRLGQAMLSDAMQSGCIPVIVADGYVMPFSEVIDWKRASVTVSEDNLTDVVQILKMMSHERTSDMQRQVCFLWKKYFSSMERITMTVLEILDSRVFPQSSPTYEDWNNPPDTKLAPNPPIFSPSVLPISSGFTAIIPTYDHMDSLIKVIQKVAQVPSLKKVIIVWNNQLKAPPTTWPKISKPLKVIQTKANRLSNRFLPFKEIETPAVLAVDDDIAMPTTDELEFGFEVWTKFPDRIVGFPSRVHTWENVTQKWKYESEWTNELSMVLTSAAFYHNHYNELYTNAMPRGIKEFVDDRMNCEDIAMNFLVSSVTGKAPIKVTPRKKFRCPECVNVEVLPSDGRYMTERSECINKFTESYGVMPLELVEFRADPVLYKDNFPQKLKRFNSVGSL